MPALGRAVVYPCMPGRLSMCAHVAQDGVDNGVCGLSGEKMAPGISISRGGKVLHLAHGSGPLRPPRRTHAVPEAKALNPVPQALHYRSPKPQVPSPPPAFPRPTSAGGRCLHNADSVPGAVLPDHGPLHKLDPRPNHHEHRAGHRGPGSRCVQIQDPPTMNLDPGASGSRIHLP